MEIEGLERTTWAADMSCEVGCKEGLGQPRRRLIGCFGGTGIVTSVLNT